MPLDAAASASSESRVATILTRNSTSELLDCDLSILSRTLGRHRLSCLHHTMTSAGCSVLLVELPVGASKDNLGRRRTEQDSQRRKEGIYGFCKEAMARLSRRHIGR